tara:strand:- start:319 stop:582 length:264 start_codon:yes stop_codon:yes gene_type:complete
VGIPKTKRKEKVNMGIFRKTNTTQTLSEFLDSYGIKQKWLSQKMGVSESLLSLLINNKRTWQFNQIEDCANALGVRRKEVLRMVDAN